MKVGQIKTDFLLERLLETGGPHSDNGTGKAKYSDFIVFDPL
jgi:hypothetical protein